MLYILSYKMKGIPNTVLEMLRIHFYVIKNTFLFHGFKKYGNTAANFQFL